MEQAEIRAIFSPVLEEIIKDSTVANTFIDRELYQINLATLWANVVLKPHNAGLEESDLETVHGIFDSHVKNVLGDKKSVKDCFGFVNTKAGEQAMLRSQLTQMHKDMLLYFCSMILDPERHERWMADNS